MMPTIRQPLASRPADPLDVAPTEPGLASGAILARRYRIIRKLGAGGMGQVYLAEDQTLKTPVAIKTVRSLLCEDPGAIARLVDEARAAMRLTHEHVVRVNHFEDGEVLKFLVMEYVEGETLAHRLAREKRLPEAEARRIGIALCDALGHAHAKGVLHRDVKPANVLLGQDGSIKLADFGIARVARDTLTTLSRQAGGPGTTAGTLAYMAPEQVEGEKASAVSDLYSLGVVLYEMVAGARPFETGAVEYQILHRPPPRPEGVSDEYAALVMRLLAKKPEERPADSNAVLSVLLRPWSVREMGQVPIDTRDRWGLSLRGELLEDVRNRELRRTYLRMRTDSVLALDQADAFREVWKVNRHRQLTGSALGLVAGFLYFYSRDPSTLTLLQSIAIAFGGFCMGRFLRAYDPANRIELVLVLLSMYCLYAPGAVYLFDLSLRMVLVYWLRLNPIPLTACYVVALMLAAVLVKPVSYRVSRQEEDYAVRGSYRNIGPVPSSDYQTYGRERRLKYLGKDW